jgi:undecaprenyl-diphosphatase
VVLLGILLPLCVGFTSTVGMAQDCAWSRIDHRLDYDGSGVWNPDVCRSIASAATVAQVGAALWQGSESRFGRTLWQGVDAQIIASAMAALGKRVFTRVRPIDGNSPCP